MKKSKGFTLIELLAVIVILAIIALIVTPVVSGIITSARNSANARSVEGHIRNVELAIVTDAFATGAGDLAIYDRTNGALPSGLTIPTNDNITCKKYTISNGQVTEATKCANKSDTANWHKTYKYTASNGAEVDGELDPNAAEYKGYVAAQAGETHKGILYIDPSDLTVSCDENSTITTTNTGCKKFYIFDDSNDTFTVIMDRNTTATVQYNSTNSSLTQNEVATSLASDTANWVGSPRLITANEVATIVDNSSWSSSTATVSNNFYFGSKNTTSYSSQNADQKAVQRSYHWLFDYTNGCTSYGCSTADSSTYGYWTSTAVSGDTRYVWYVSYGFLYYNDASHASSYGIRPVLEIPKSLLEE